MSPADIVAENSTSSSSISSVISHSEYCLRCLESTNKSLESCIRCLVRNQKRIRTVCRYILLLVAITTFTFGVMAAIPAGPFPERVWWKIFLLFAASILSLGNACIGEPLCTVNVDLPQ